MSVNKFKYENCKINTAEIRSNVNGDTVNISGGEVQYSESMFNDTIEVDYIFANRAGTINGQTLLEGLPLFGTEDFVLDIQDSIGNNIKVELNVNKVTPIRKDTQQEQLLLRLTSEEYIRNEEITSSIVKRYNGKISESVEKILSDKLGTGKDLFIEETNNNYNFVGNVRKPFYIINWLAKKSVPAADGKVGKTAGYMFYETSLGFHFRSIDGLFAQDHIRSYVFSDTPDVLKKTDQYDGEIVRINTDNRFIANEKYRMGVYSTKLIAFDPYSCKYAVFNRNAFDDEDGITTSGKNLPTLNPKFNTQSTRTTYVIKDTGSLPSGDLTQQIKKSSEENFQAEIIMNQAISRYNQFSTGVVEIDIAPDFDLHAGDAIFIDVPDTGGGSTDKLISGKYVIAILKHAIRNGKGVTKLGLVRDSFGRKGKPHSGSMVN
tara:strand:+ start:1780 stop:3078 length:1299 start_codon:yes stop_codon:yes gene_type:complete